MSVFQVKGLAFIVVFFLIAMSGCSTTSGLKMHDSVEGHQIEGSNVSLRIATQDTSDDDDIARQLRGALASKLLGAGLFEKISSQDNESSEYTISIALTEVKNVSGAARVMLGVLSGNNKVGGDVNVINNITGQTVRSFSFIGESASHPMSGKSDMKDAIDEAANVIVNGLS